MPETRICPECGASYEDTRVRFCTRDGATLVTVDEPRTPGGGRLIGRVLADKYRVLERLGQGGMGTVFLAEQLSVGREIALKVLLPVFAGDRTATARFRREARAASLVESPHVVTIHDFGESNEGLLYIAMEHLKGESLGERLRREGALPVDEAIRIARAIAAALSAAHEAGVIHRDLKPDNVMLCAPDASVKVLDFGIAKIAAPEWGPLPDKAQLTQPGSMIGTPMYMSPEAVARGSVGPSSDLYSLGVILFEMLVGRPPFEDPEPVLLMGMHLRVPAPKPSETDAKLELPEDLEALVCALLAKRKEDRPASPREVEKRLAEMTVTDREAPSIRPLARREREEAEGAARETRRPRRASSVAAAGLVALAAGAAWMAAASESASTEGAVEAEMGVDAEGDGAAAELGADTGIDAQRAATGHLDSRPLGPDAGARAEPSRAPLRDDEAQAGAATGGRGDSRARAQNEGPRSGSAARTTRGPSRTRRDPSASRMDGAGHMPGLVSEF